MPETIADIPLFVPPALAALAWLWTTLQVAVVALGLLMALGTLASLTRLPWWFVRGWDFPRLQIATVAIGCGIGDLALARARGGTGWFDWLFLAVMAVIVAWQAWRIHDYTPLGKREIKPATAGRGSSGVLRIVISNVLEKNRQFDRWRKIIEREVPDVILAAEVDDDWVREINRSFGESHPHQVSQAQSNCYGMALWSRLPLIEPRLEFIVQEDIPSIHTQLELGDGTIACLHCLHPRPPVPQEQATSSPRDAELVIVGKRIRQEREDGHAEPTIVVGDLNDVAWSRTTRLFQKLSGLLDPRRGRGLYNTFNANSRIFRFPLDHVFVSREFRLMDLRVLESVGSDHFPVRITLSHEPEKQAQQHEHRPDAEDVKEAQETILTQQEREVDGTEDGHLSR